MESELKELHYCISEILISVATERLNGQNLGDLHTKRCNPNKADKPKLLPVNILKNRHLKSKYAVDLMKYKNQGRLAS